MKTHTDIGASQDRANAVLFGLVAQDDPRSAPEALHELGLLADTGTFEILGYLVQHRRSPDPHTYLGSGKLLELAEVAQQAHANLVICDESLTPIQGRNVEAAVGLPVLDRSELILHIFGIHARTRQAKLQVELASLRYQLPRLKRMWTHLERQRGGIGMRGGAGEKQIDLDRGYIRTRLGTIVRHLKQIEAHRQRQMLTRSDFFSVALVGYTNAGKSSLMNRLTFAGVAEADRLFSTLDTRTRPWRLPGGRTVLLSDTVGFIRNLPHELVASFHATLEEALAADLLLVVVDCSTSEARDQLETVDGVLQQLGAAGIPRVTVLNKYDLVSDHADLAALLRHDPQAIAVSARTGAGLDSLGDRLVSHLAASERRVRILVPHAVGGLHAEVRRSATVLSEDYGTEGCMMEILAHPTLIAKLVAHGAELD
jgi:GTP-binding protein HflX